MSMSQAKQNTNPFPGLRPFLESELHLFFGRESQIDAMVDKLAANRFLAVVGTSGSGKSSLVNCGLRPALRTGLMANAGTAWRMAQCRPGGDPIAALANALAEDGVLFTNFQNAGLSLCEIVDTTLRMGKLGLIDMVEQAQLPKTSNLLLVIDQFEELFRYRHLDEQGANNYADIEQQAAAFVNLLLATIGQSKLPVYVVITMRSDFLGDCAQFPGLAEAINRGQYLVPRMTREQRRAAITGPIGVGGAKIYPALLTRLVNDVGTNPDQLSILQHALNRTWSFWENDRGRQGMLDIECYDSIGSMTSALDQHADKAFAELDTEKKRKICETLFKALTDKASDARGVRRPTRLKTLCEMCDATPAQLISVMDVFRKPSRSFLMPPNGFELNSDTVIDISHESLMRVWRRLDLWADEEAEAARMYQRLAETSKLYEEKKAGLLRNPDLRIALNWRDQHKPTATWAKQYNPGFDSVVSFLKRSEKSDLTRKRLWSASIATAVLAIFGYVAHASYDKISELSVKNEQLFKQRKQALVDLDEAEQEKIDAWNQVQQVKDDALDQFEFGRQKVAFDIEENLNRILTEESKLSQPAAKLDESETPGTSFAAKEQIQFFDAISSLQNKQRESIVEHITQLDSDLNEFQTEYSEKLAHYQTLEIQKHIQCELNSVTRHSELQMCNQIMSGGPSVTESTNLSDETQVECKQSTLHTEALENLNEQQRTFVSSKSEQLACAIETIKDKIAKLDSASTNLKSDIDSLRVKAVAANTSEQAGGASQTRIKRFQACENVEKLIASGCKDENQSFSPGKVFVFARVVTGIEDETITLRWFNNKAEEPFSEKQFSVKPNPDGYRTYTWKSLDNGTYRACLYNQSDEEMKCIGVKVGNSATSSPIDAESQVQAIADRPATTESIDQDNAETNDVTGWEATTLEDSEDDGFVVCEDVVKLQPINCASELDPGKIYAFARVVTPHDQETVTLHWFKEGVEMQELRKELGVKRNSKGYRTYSWNTLSTGSYAVSLSDQKGEELKKIQFEVR